MHIDKKAGNENVQNENAGYLLWFKDYLIDQGLSLKTVDRHLKNLDFFLNEFLTSGGVRRMEDGLFAMDEYFGSYFMSHNKKASVGSLKSNAESIKKFYLCMFEHGKVTSSEYVVLCRDIKEGMPGWLRKSGN